MLSDYLTLPMLTTVMYVYMYVIRETCSAVSSILTHGMEWNELQYRNWNQRISTNVYVCTSAKYLTACYFRCHFLILILVLILICCMGILVLYTVA